MFLTSKADESTSGAVVPQGDVVQKLVLLPTNLKLAGAANYLSWSQRAMLVMEPNDLDGHLLGQETRLVRRERSGRASTPCRLSGC
jgi:hypothetical protein